MYIRYKQVHPRARLPKKAYASAGYDLYSVDFGIILAGSKELIKLGFQTEFDPGFVALIQDRSSMGNKSMIRLAGVIDSDFRGEWAVILFNLGQDDFIYSPIKAIAQVLFIPLADVVGHDSWSESLDSSERGSGMLGSSDLGAK